MKIRINCIKKWLKFIKSVMVKDKTKVSKRKYLGVLSIISKLKRNTLKFYGGGSEVYIIDNCQFTIA